MKSWPLFSWFREGGRGGMELEGLRGDPRSLPLHPKACPLPSCARRAAGRSCGPGHAARGRAWLHRLPVVRAPRARGPAEGRAAPRRTRPRHPPRPRGPRGPLWGGDPAPPRHARSGAPARGGRRCVDTAHPTPRALVARVLVLTSPLLPCVALPFPALGHSGPSEREQPFLNAYTRDSGVIGGNRAQTGPVLWHCCPVAMTYVMEQCAQSQHSSARWKGWMRYVWHLCNLSFPSVGIPTETQWQKNSFICEVAVFLRMSRPLLCNYAESNAKLTFMTLLTVAISIVEMRPVTIFHLKDLKCITFKCTAPSHSVQMHSNSHCAFHLKFFPSKVTENPSL
jgi:hypothetical protein